jgi:hypothetical protein
MISTMNLELNVKLYIVKNFVLEVCQRDRLSTTRTVGNDWRELIGRSISMSFVDCRIRTFGPLSYRLDKNGVQ